MKQTVLIVDDNPNNLQLAGSVLSPYYRLILVESGEKAMQIIETRQPDIILLDIMMPDISGIELCRMLKANEKTRHIPVIFLTAKNEENDIEEGFDAGGSDYVAKPFKAKELLARIKTQLDLLEAKRRMTLSNDELKQTVAQRDRFFSIIAHDLRSPFSGLLGFIDIMIEGLNDFNKDEIEEYLKNTRMYLTRQYHLLENLLRWAQIQRGDLNISYEDLVIDDMIKEVIEESKLKAEQKEIRVDYSLEKEFVIRTDKNIFQSIIRNLLSNAVKFSFRGSVISVNVEAFKDDCIRISVRDTGVGMRQADAKRLFKVDEKVSLAGTENEPSSGLGLLLCKEYVEKLGGTIGVDTEPDKGSSFYFVLPGLSQRN